MAKKHEQKDQATEVLENVEQSLTNAEVFIEKNRNPLFVGVAVVLGIALLFFAYQRFYAEPLEEEAQQEVFMAQKYLEQDSLKLALNGQGNHLGFLDIADEYSNTKVGNLANYYAGVCYLNLGEFENAIEYLDKFKGNDEVLSVVAKGAIGDAFLEINQPEDALEYYTKASKTNNNEFVIPIYLLKAAQTAEILKDYKTALSNYKKLKSDFPTSPEAKDIDKNIAFAQTKMETK